MNPKTYTQEELLLVPIHTLIRKLEQQVQALEWDGDFSGASRVDFELQHVRSHHQATGTKYFPLF